MAVVILSAMVVLWVVFLAYGAEGWAYIRHCIWRVLIQPARPVVKFPVGWRRALLRRIRPSGRKAASVSEREGF